MSSPPDRSPEPLDAALAVWRRRDLAHALHPEDRAAIDATDPPRALVLELLAFTSHERDLYSACARLGRSLAEAGASPTLAVTTLDGAADALQSVSLSCGGERMRAARASLAEGYIATRSEFAHAEATRAWEYPACAVPLDALTVAVAGGYPSGDNEALSDWCARVALAVSKAGYRRARVGGPERTRCELEAALRGLGVVTLSDETARQTWLGCIIRRLCRPRFW
jgi:hypothetical protein